MKRDKNVNDDEEVINSKDTLLKEKTIAEYFKSIRNYSRLRNSIFTGESLYEFIFNLQSAPYEKRILKKEFEDFLSINFFDNKGVIITAVNEPDNYLNIKIGDELEFPVHQLGDGIQSIIILTFPLFLNRKNRLILFIEEPELNLHPGFQRILVKTYSKFNNATIFFTTHSNHLLDLTADYDGHVSIFRFSKSTSNRQTSFNINNVSSPDVSLLRELGVKNSSVFLTNATIWVEGITDRFYIRKYLEIYQKYQKSLDDGFIIYTEDIHYSFFEYSGGNITHWSFLEEDKDESLFKNISVKKLCATFFLITDKDNTESEPNSKKSKRLESLSLNLKDRFYKLNCKEIENSLTEDIIKLVVRDFEKHKNKSEVEFSDFGFNDYKDVSLGRFLNKVVINKAIKSYSSESGTIKRKIHFCKLALEHMDSYKHMSKEANVLAGKIYNFIREMN